jgi:hypothetical protein
VQGKCQHGTLKTLNVYLYNGLKWNYGLNVWGVLMEIENCVNCKSKHDCKIIEVEKKCSNCI